MSDVESEAGDGGSISIEQFSQILNQTLNAQKDMFLQVLQQANHGGGAPQMASVEQIMESLGNRMEKFIYDGENNVTFEKYFNRNGDIFTEEGKNLDDKAKTRLLLSKLGQQEFELHANHILPKTPKELDFNETVATLKKLFGPTRSLFALRYKCMKLKCDTNDLVTFGGIVNAAVEKFEIVNAAVEKFEIGKLTPDALKCLVFTCSLSSPDQAILRTRCLKLMEEKPDSTLNELINDCQKYLTLAEDTKLIESNEAVSSASVNAVKQQKFQKKQKKFHNSQGHENRNNTQKSQKKIECYCCGGNHKRPDCKLQDSICNFCSTRGHLEKMCGKKKKQQQNNQSRGSNKSSYQGNPRVQRIYTINRISLSNRRYAHFHVNKLPIVTQVDNAADISILPKKCVDRLKVKIFPTQVKAKTANGTHLALIGEATLEFSFNEKKVHHKIYVTNGNLHLMGADLMEKLGMFDTPLNKVCSTSGTCGCCQNTPIWSRPNYPQEREVGEAALLEWVDSLEVASLGREDIKKDFVNSLKRKFPKIFEEGLGKCTKFKAKLMLKPDAKPIYRPKRPVPYASLPAVEKELTRLESLGVIQSVVYSEWAAPILCVRKPNGSIRLCADYSTGLNDNLLTHDYPMHLPEDIFASLCQNSTYFSKIDMSEAFLQIEVDEASKPLLTINTHKGLYMVNRLQFGVKIAPGIFQQIMDSMVSGLSGTTCYMDDIIVTGKDLKEHKKNLLAVFARIAEYGFKIKLEKCTFFSNEIKYLGHIINKEGRRPDPAKTQAISKMPAPTNVKEVRSFLGLINYYGSYVHAMTDLRAPLDRLLHEDVKFEWDENCQEAFEKAKNILTSDLMLTHYNPRLQIVVAADASEVGLGAVISHRFKDGSEKPIYYASRVLSATEKNYSQTEKEGLAIIFALQKFHKYVYGRPFILVSDHKPLLQIFGSKKGIPVYAAKRLTRWCITLLGYDFKMEFKNTAELGIADTLSRLINTQDTSNDEVVIAAIDSEVEISAIFTNAFQNVPVTASEVIQHTREDPILKKICSFLQNGWPNKPEDEILPYYTRKEALSLVNECLFFGERLTSNITTYATIRFLNQLFSRFGLPRKLVSDNGAAYISHEFERYCEANGIHHSKTAVYTPMSNGQAERFVDTFKRALTKMQHLQHGQLDEKLQLFLATYRNTPNPALSGSTPSEIFLGRKVRTTFDLLKSTPSQEKFRDVKMETQFNKKHGAKEREFQVGQAVHAMNFRNPKKPTWFSATILEKCGNVLYKLKTQKGICFRHANQLRPAYGVLQSTTQDLMELVDFFEIPTTAVPVAPNGNQPQPVVPDSVAVDPQPEPQPVRPYVRRPRHHHAHESPMVRRSNRARKLVQPFDPAQQCAKDQEDQRRRRNLLLAQIFAF
uniref:RNA-directed DNA polymerase n=1 Tax=Acrobeloides nanus TaxID=290746 RepID=A0A914CIN6_9BILA